MEQISRFIVSNRILTAYALGGLVVLSLALLGLLMAAEERDGEGNAG